jgi:phosphoglucosamine mutase
MLLLSEKMLFGTDGIRGTINRYPMTPEEMLKLALALGRFLQDFSRHEKGYKNKVVIVKDTRLSGYIIESILTGGLAAMGVNVTLVGPLPTPAVPMLIKSLRADLGIMITASHNPFYDNGIKLFNHHGCKLSFDKEKEIENLLKNHLAIEEDPGHLGKVIRIEDVQGRYIEFVKSSFPKELNLEGLRIVIDSANGAAYKIAPAVLWELGAEVVALGSDPNGLNINDSCGSMHPSALAAKVVETRSDLGIALDGDGDRLLVCDEIGKIVQGDHLIGLIAEFLQKKGKLKGGVVLTHLANSALEKRMKEIGIKVFRTNVGDKNVFYEMKKHHCNFGGETSGHIILSDYSSTGDGIIAALQILALLKESNQKASEILHYFPLTPQSSISINYDGDYSEQTKNRITKFQEENLDKRIIVRKSGTEKLLRLMVEGDHQQEVDRTLQNLKEILMVDLQH